jgi:hypothetical protein
MCSLCEQRALVVDLDRERRRRRSPIVTVAGRRFRVVRPMLARVLTRIFAAQ